MTRTLTTLEELREARAAGPRLSAVTLAGLDLAGEDLSGGVFFGVRFERCSFRLARMSDASFVGCVFLGGELGL